MRTLTLPMLSLLLLVALGGRALADTGNPALDAAIAQYDDLEYEHAITAITAALTQADLTVAQRAAGLHILALCHLALGHDDDALAAFTQLLAIDPDYQLPEGDSAKAHDLFARVQAARPKPVHVRSSASPPAPRAGDQITLALQVDDPDHRVTQLVVSYRTRGGKSYSSVTLAHTAATDQAVLSGAFVNAPGLDYYVVALDGSGATLASEGDADHPLGVPVSAPAARDKPLYAKWWFWTGVGGVAVLGGVAALLLLSGDGGGDQDSTVTITVH